MTADESPAPLTGTRVVGAAATVLFYSLIVVLGIVLLAAIQLRSPGGAAFDTWRLNYAATQSLIASREKQLGLLQERARTDANSLHVNQACLRLFDQNGNPEKGLIDQQTAKQVEEARRANIPHDKLRAYQDVGCLVKGYTLLKSDLQHFESVLKDGIAETDELKKSLALANEQLADLVKGHQDFLAFREMEGLWYQRPFIVAPYDLLVLLLVMLMGALGGMVRLLRDYGAPQHPNPNHSDYFFVPLIGAVVAIGGYVLAKTGLLLLSSARGETSLSPFMISLVGIVSGLLAKEVIDTIAARGRRMFSREPDGRRASSTVDEPR